MIFKDKSSIHNSSLPNIILRNRDMNNPYQRLGKGDEGVVRQYNTKIAFKIFTYTSCRMKLQRKFAKIETLAKLQDEAACFPLGLVGYENGKKEGYYMDLVDINPKYSDVNALKYLQDMKQAFEYIKKIDAAVQRFHEKGIILGDIKGNNIMIDKDGNPKFVDTDNWMYGEYGFDVRPCRSTWLRKDFGKNRSLLDNDKYIFALMIINFLRGVSVPGYNTSKYLSKMIEIMNVSKEVKDGLRLIFSDAYDKPYIAEVLEKVDFEEEILSEEAIKQLKKIY